MMIKKIPKIERVFSAFIAFSWLISGYVLAQPLEDINFQTETDRVVATIVLSTPVHNVRYFPVNRGTTLEILLDKLPVGSGNVEWLDNEVKKSPPSSLIPSFTVKTNLKNIQPKLVIDFSREAEYTVNAGRDGRSIVVGIKIDRVQPTSVGGLPFLPEVKTLAPNATDVNKQAAALMSQGRNTLAAPDNFAAIDAFNKLLFLPPNDYTQDAQEWIGVARERAGLQDKAKLEYELYLKLYPNSEGVERIKTRLSRLGAKQPSSSVTAERPALKKQAKQTITYGSLSMHYYHGASKIDTIDTVAQLSNPLSTSTFSTLDQSALLTSVVATERFISEDYDNRLVFQDTAYSNFLPGQTSKNRLSTAYFEVKNKQSDYSVRMGRQSAYGGGVMGRFDGALLGFAATPSMRVNAVAGQLSDYNLGPKPIFYGVSVDMGPVTLYAINQTIEGIVDRRAVGTELRYFEPRQTAFVLLDYDTHFSVLNTAMFQGTFSPTTERTYSLLLDHRKAPYISTRNSLNGALTTSVTELLQLITEDELHALAEARTGTANLAMLGMTQQISPKWQIGGDIRVSSYEGLPASGIIDPNDPNFVAPSLTGLVPETPGTGNDWAISPQLIGSNLYSSRDVTVFSMSYMAGALYKGQSFYVYSRANISDKWSMDASLQYYRQNYESGMFMTRIMPTLRATYQFRQSLSFDMDAGVELSHSENANQITEGQRQFFSLGFRWDF